MTKKAKLIRNIFILVVLFLIIKTFFFGSFTALSAFKKAEKASNYGPSKIVKTLELDGEVLYLTKYNEWCSLSSVRRGFLGLWYPRKGFYGELYNDEVPIYFSTKYSGNDSNALITLHGIVNDSNIKSVKSTLKVDDRIIELEEKNLEENIFLLSFQGECSNHEVLTLIGLDKDSKVIYEYKNKASK